MAPDHAVAQDFGQKVRIVFRAIGVWIWQFPVPFLPALYHAARNRVKK
jgi:hypothetical protein